MQRGSGSVRRKKRYHRSQKMPEMRKTSSRPLDLSDQSCPIRILEQLYVYVREMIERPWLCLRSLPHEGELDNACWWWAVKIQKNLVPLRLGKFSTFEGLVGAVTSRDLGAVVAFRTPFAAVLRSPISTKNKRVFALRGAGP